MWGRRGCPTAGSLSLDENYRVSEAVSGAVDVLGSGDGSCTFKYRGFRQGAITGGGEVPELFSLVAPEDGVRGT